MRLFGTNLFGNNIDVNCEYCHNGQKSEGMITCKLNKTIENGNCSNFKYNPLMRVPRVTPNLPKYDPEDFKL